MRRGDVVSVALSGDYGKPRPALVVQSDLFDEHPSVTVLPMTTELRAAPLFRIEVGPTPDNGLQQVSQLMVDKIQSIPRSRAGATIGRLTDRQMLGVERAMAVFLGFA